METKPNLNYLAAGAKFTFLVLAVNSLFIKYAAAQAQQGFTQQENIKIAGITADAQIYNLPLTQKQTVRTYYDGLGRGLQTVGVQASPLQRDLIQPAAYDSLGRQTRQYLPYAGQPADITGSYRSNATSTAQPAFYSQAATSGVAADGSPYTQQVFENSPLQRLLSAGMAGAGFQPVAGQHYKSVSYRPNLSADGSILVWNPDGTYTAGRTYAAGTLSVTDGRDEDNTETLVFTDLEGHTILKRQVLAGGNLDTYYIYNLAGLICFIIPPKAVGLLAANSYNLAAAPLSNLVFSFIYNNRGQLMQKAVPGKGLMSIVYDPLNRPVLLQDANMYAANKWNYIKYDVKGRAVSQGIYTDATYLGRAAMQGHVSGVNYTVWYESRSAAAANGGYYTNTIFPAVNITPLAYVYYDDYFMTQGSSPDFGYLTQKDAALPNEETATAAQLKGMPTILCQSTVGAGLSNTWLTKVTFYDRQLHPIQVRSNNHVYYSGYTSAAALTDTKTEVNDFAGVPQRTKVSHQTGASATVTVYTSLSYDHVYRLTGVSQQYGTGGSYKAVAAYSYNELGQVIKKGLGYVNAAAWLQNVDMRYNIRGQLTTLNNSTLTADGGVTNSDGNDVFGMQLLYDKQDGSLNNGAGNSPYYNGKLSAVKWMSGDGSGNNSHERSYTYSYDAVNRYTGESYAERITAGTGSFGNNLHGFDEAGITYDAGGNILTLTRNSSTQGTNSNVQTDNLTYTYKTNSPGQLATVTDGTDASHTGAGFRNLTGSLSAYGYDANGNLSNDYYKGLALTYDDLNRTDRITVTTGTNQYISYTYDGSGSMIRKQAYNNNTLQTTTDYIEGFNYVNGTLSYFTMPEGRVLNNAGTFTREYIITDPQGNARVSFQDNGSGVAAVKQENSYYGFGLILPNSPVATPPTPNKQLYNGGSEWQNDYSNLPDYQQTFYRNYDAAIGRFIGVDPMAEASESMTTYQYAGNNPIMYNDPMGNLLRYVQPPSYYSLQSNTQLGPGGNMGDDFDDDASYNEYAYGGGYDQGGGSGGDPNVDGSSYYGNTSALDGGDYSQQWTRILSGSGISLNANGGAYISSTRSALAYPLNTSAGTVLLKFTGDGQLTSYSVDPAPGPHGLIATEDGVTITLLQTLINLSPQIDVENQAGDNNAGENLGTLNGAADNALTIAGGMHYAQTGEEVVGVLKWAGKVTGLASVGNNVYKAWTERKTNGWQAALHLSEAIAQGGFMLFGGEEVELAWNLGSIAIDTGIDYYNHSTGTK